MLFSESRCFSKKTRPVPSPIMDADGQITGPWEQDNSRNSISQTYAAPPTRPARAYSNKALQTPTKSPLQQMISPSWMRKFSLPSSSRSTSTTSSRASSISSASSSGAPSSRKLSLPTIRRKKSELKPQIIQERRPSLWTHHSNGHPRTVFKNAGRDERGRLRLEYMEYEQVEW